MIYDCLLYASLGCEKRLFEIRHAELACLGVQHVVIESDVTFTGLPKVSHPLGHYPNTHHELLPMSTWGTDMTPWEREKFQRNYIKQVLEQQFHPKPDDIIILSDVDEIARWQVVKQYRPHFGQCALLMDVLYFYLNTFSSRQTWRHAKIFPYSHLNNLTPEQIRNEGAAFAMLDAGHHFTYMGDVDTILEKFKAFSHQEANVQAYANRELLEDKRWRLTGIWDNSQLLILEPTELPEYVQKNTALFKDLLYVQ